MNEMEVTYWYAFIKEKWIPSGKALDMKNIVFAAIYAKKKMNDEQSFMAFETYFKTNFRPIWNQFEGIFLVDELNKGKVINNMTINLKFKELYNVVMEGHDVIDYN